MGTILNAVNPGKFNKELQGLKTDMGEGFDAETFMKRGLTFLARHILLNLESAGIGSVRMADGRHEPSACVSIHHYQVGEKGRRVKIPFDGEHYRTFCLDPLQQRDKDSEEGYSFTAAMGEFLKEDALLSLVDAYDRSQACMEKGFFSPRAFVEGRLLPAESPYRKDLPRDYHIFIPETYYRENPDKSPAYYACLGRDAKVLKQQSYTAFFRAASCMEAEGEEESIFFEWRKTPDAAVWERRHRGRSFSHLVIPVTDTFGTLMTIIEVFGLFPSASSDPRLSRFFQDLIRWVKLSAWDINQYPAADEFHRSTLSYALSSVLSRNLSHNIGSHVYSSLSRPETLESLSIKDGPYFGLEGDPFEIKTQDDGKLFIPSVQMAALNNYIRNRMNYLSDMGNGSPTSLYTLHLRDEVIRDLDRTRLLLNHISGLGAEFPYKLDLQIGSGAADVQVAIPNHVVGSHALYNILENVIRNVAKHGNSRQKINVFTLKVSEEKDFPDMYSVLLYHDKAYSVKESGEIVSMMNGKIAAPALEGSSLRLRDWGVLEMKAAAAFLRQEDILHAVDDNYIDTPPLLEAVSIPAGEGIAFWGYRFYLLKPRDFLIVTDGGNEGNGEDVISVSDLGHDLGERKSVPYSFLVYEDVLPTGLLKQPSHEAEALRSLMDEYRSSLPVRVLPKSAFGGRKIDHATCWQVWTERNADRWPRKEFLHEVLPTDNTRPSAQAVIISHGGEGHPLPEVVESELRKTEPLYLEALSSEAAGSLPYYHKAGNLTGYVGLLTMGREDAEEFMPGEVHDVMRGMMLEAVNTRVFILDERIQQEACKQKYMCAKVIDLLEIAGVKVPSLDQFKLNAEYMDDETCSSLLSLIGSAMTENDFVVLHYGLLERIFKRRAGKEGDWYALMRDQFQEWVSRKGAGEIVVESGRGSMISLPPTARFLSFSSLSYATLELRNKVVLTGLLFAARRAGRR